MTYACHKKKNFIYENLNLEPLVTVREHSHWLWSVRYKSFHDQLILTAGSDCRVQLHSQVGNYFSRMASKSINNR